MEAVKGQKTLIELASEFGVHPVQIAQWKRQLLDASTEIFESGSPSRREREQEQLVDRLYQEIGQLKVEVEARRLWLYGFGPVKIILHCPLEGTSKTTTTSNGQAIANPRFFLAEERAPAKAQRRLSKEAKGTPERARRRKVIARVHEHIAWRRGDLHAPAQPSYREPV